MEQFLAEVKQREQIGRTLDKMASVMEKFEALSILHDHRIKQLERKVNKKYGKR